MPLHHPPPSLSCCSAPDLPLGQPGPCAPTGSTRLTSPARPRPTTPAARQDATASTQVSRLAGRGCWTRKRLARGRCWLLREVGSQMGSLPRRAGAYACMTQAWPAQHTTPHAGGMLDPASVRTHSGDRVIASPLASCWCASQAHAHCLCGCNTRAGTVPAGPPPSLPPVVGTWPSLDLELLPALPSLSPPCLCKLRMHGGAIASREAGVSVC